MTATTDFVTSLNDECKMKNIFTCISKTAVKDITPLDTVIPMAFNKIFSTISFVYSLKKFSTVKSPIKDNNLKSEIFNVKSSLTCTHNDHVRRGCFLREQQDRSLNINCQVYLRVVFQGFSCAIHNISYSVSYPFKIAYSFQIYEESLRIKIFNNNCKVRRRFNRTHL